MESRQVMTFAVRVVLRHKLYTGHTSIRELIIKARDEVDARNVIYREAAARFPEWDIERSDATRAKGATV